MLVPLWVAVVAALAGLVAGAALVHAVHMYALQPSDGKHDDRAGYSVAETSARIRKRDSDWIHLRPVPARPRLDDHPTQPIYGHRPALPWPVTITYRQSGE